jgi:hypothetical protein
MSIIKLPLLFAGSLGEKHIYTLYDSGRFAVATNLSCIHPAQIEGLEVPVHLGRTRMIGTAAVGHYIEVTEAVRLDFYMNDVLLSDEFLVIPGLSEDAIIGAATMQKWRIKLDFEHDIAIVERPSHRLRLPKCN